MQSCAIDSRHWLFRCSHREKKFVSQTCEKRSQKYLVSESRGAPVNQTFIRVKLMYMIPFCLQSQSPHTVIKMTHRNKCQSTTSVKLAKVKLTFEIMTHFT